MKVTEKHLNLIRDMGAAFLAARGYTFADIVTGRDAWSVLHQSGAYRAIGDDYVGGYPDYKDAHLQTTLAHVMPNAVFKDAKVY